MSDLDQSNDDPGLNRRNFLKGVGAVGISTAAINHISENEATIGDITYNPQKEVPYVAGWSNELKEEGEVEKEPFYKTMSIDKWDRLQTTEDAVDQLNDFLDSLDIDLHSGFIESFDEDSSTKRRIDIILNEETPYEEKEVLEYVPETVKGRADVAEYKLEVPIGVRKVEFQNESGECYSTPYTEYDDVPGAAPIYMPDTGEGGMIAGPFVHSTDGIGWVTAQHVAEDENNIVELAEDSLTSTGVAIGEVNETHYEKSCGGKIDVAHILRTVSGKEPHEWIAGEHYNANEDLPITTVIADTELETVVGNTGWNVNVQGQMNCRGESYVDEIVRDCNNEVVGFAIGSDKTDGGDSGGPYFHKRDGEAYMCGVHSGTKDDGRSYATTAETTEDVLNGDWMTQ